MAPACLGKVLLPSIQLETDWMNYVMCVIITWTLLPVTHLLPVLQLLSVVIRRHIMYFSSVFYFLIRNLRRCWEWDVYTSHAAQNQNDVLIIMQECRVNTGIQLLRKVVMIWNDFKCFCIYMWEIFSQEVLLPQRQRLYTRSYNWFKILHMQMRE